MSRKPAERGYYCMVDFFQSFGKGDYKSIILKITTDRSAFKSKDSAFKSKNSDSFYCCLKASSTLIQRFDLWLELFRMVFFFFFQVNRNNYCVVRKYYSLLSHEEWVSWQISRARSIPHVRGESNTSGLPNKFPLNERRTSKI